MPAYGGPRPEGPVLNRPDRKVGTPVATMKVSAEGAALDTFGLDSNPGVSHLRRSEFLIL